MKYAFAIAMTLLGLPACVPIKKPISEVTATGSNSCTFNVGVPTSVLQLRSMTKTLGRQREEQWCWAASAQMVLNYHEVDVTQEMIVTRAYGSELNRPAKADTLVDSLNGIKAIVNGKAMRVEARKFPLIFTLIQGDMIFQHPQIVALRNLPLGTGSHARAVTAISFHVDPISGKDIPDYVTMRDPWPTRPSKEVMAWDEFAARFVYLVRVRLVDDN